VIKDDKDAISYRNGVISQLRKQQAAYSGNGVPKDDAGQFAPVTATQILLAEAKSSGGMPTPACKSTSTY
jgi:hypothetical protein